jgi:sec-independent protein translocase protein TatC
MSGQLTTHVTVAMVAGLILAFPVITWEFWQFFKPALKPNEARYARGAVTAASGLFFRRSSLRILHAGSTVNTFSKLI